MAVNEGTAMERSQRMLLPGCEQRGEHPLSWHRRDKIWARVSLVLSLSSEKGPGVGWRLQCWQGGGRGNSSLSLRAALVSVLHPAGI